MGVYIVPGIVFGVILGSWFFVTEKNRGMGTLFWVGFSTIAYFLANRTFLRVSDNIGNITYSNHFTGNLIDGGFVGFLLAGLVGSTVLVIATNFLIARLKLTQILFIILLGAILGLFFTAESGLVTPFILWQLGVGMALAVSVNHNKRLTQ